MIRKLFFLLCALLVASNIAMAKNFDKEFTLASNSFSNDIYQKTIEGQSGNVIISPFSIQTALSLAMFGTKEGSETRNQMLTGLKYKDNYDVNTVADNYKIFTQSLKPSDGLSVANKIYVMKDFTVKPAFKHVAEESFNSDAENIDFRQNKDAANKINKWVEDKTNNKIKDLIKEDSVGPDTRMVLVNAIHFKGTWKYQFDKQMTYKAPFYLDAEKSVDVDFMKMKQHFKYGEIRDLGATALEMQYQGSDITMLFILPKEQTGLADLEKKLANYNIKDITDNMSKVEVNVEIPKFKIDFDIELEEPLKKMGMKKMFDDGTEFDELLQQSQPLKVSSVIHKAFIEVNEEGAEAAAATGIRIMKRSLPMYHDFIAQHPFIFALLCHETKAIYFVGRIKHFDDDSSTHDEL